MVLLGSATEGTKRMETKDADGYQMVKEIIRVGQESDGGYTDYVFPKEGETESSPKRSYSRAFEPFGWVSERETILTISMRLLRKKRRQCGECKNGTDRDYRNGAVC